MGGNRTSQTVAGLPAPPLRPFVDRYVGYRQVGFRPGVHRRLPSRHLTSIVSIGDRIDVLAQTDARQAPARYDVVVGGHQASAAFIAHDGNQDGVAVELTPLGCRALLGMPQEPSGTPRSRPTRSSGGLRSSCMSESELSPGGPNACRLR